jgi:molecular chaperone GrpE
MEESDRTNNQVAEDFDNKHFRIYNAGMVNKKQENEHIEDTDIEITNESLDNNEDVELQDSEEHTADTIKSLRAKLKAAQAEKQVAQEDLQRTKADFLNARRRLEEERLRDRDRSKSAHVEELIPLCDSFEMAMSNKEVWQKADETWRRGIEGIFAQLNSLLTSYGVSTVEPLGADFDPASHDALSTTPVTDASQHDKVVAVIQKGYLMKRSDGSTELVRPARVTIGKLEN